MRSLRKVLATIRAEESTGACENLHSLYYDLRDFLTTVSVRDMEVGVEVEAYLEELDAMYTGHGLTEEEATKDLLCRIVDGVHV